MVAPGQLGGGVGRWSNGKCWVTEGLVVATFMGRILRAAKLDANLYEEVAAGTAGSCRDGHWCSEDSIRSPSNGTNVYIPMDGLR